MVIPSIGGILVSLFGARIGFFINAISFVVSVLFVHMIPINDVPVSGAQGWRKHAFWSDFREGLNVVLRSRRFIGMLLVQACSITLVSANNALIMPFVTRVMGKGAAEYGYLSSALAAGLLIGSLAAGQYRDRTKMVKLLPFGVGIIGCCLLSLTALHSLPTVLLIRVVYGFGLALADVAFYTVMQLSSPEGLRARISSVFQASANAVSTLSLGIAGSLADVVGIAGMFGVVGGLGLVVAVYGLIATRSLFGDDFDRL